MPRPKCVLIATLAISLFSAAGPVMACPWATSCGGGKCINHQCHKMHASSDTITQKNTPPAELAPQAGKKPAGVTSFTYKVTDMGPATLQALALSSLAGLGYASLKRRVKK